MHDHHCIDEIAVVIHPSYREEMQRVAQRNKWPKLTKTVTGGEERVLSTLAAVEAFRDYSPDSTNLLLHDAARPFVSNQIITGVTQALQHHQAVAVGAPCHDTVWQTTPDGFIASIPDRGTLRNAQTPQAFRLALLQQARRLFMDQHNRLGTTHAAMFTDDCSLILHYLPDTKIHIIPGNPENKKITTPSDLP